MRKKIKSSGKHLGLIIGILLIATSLRAPFTSVAPLLESIRDDFSLSAARAGVLQTLPLLAFALFSPLAAGFGRRLGMERTLFVALLIVVAGIVIRSCAGLAGLFGGTLLIGLGIALGNVLLPGLLKRDLPHRAASLTGLYALTMGLAAALASAVMIPFTTFFHTGWSSALLMTLALPMVALIVWLPRLKRDPVAATHGAAHPHAPARVWRSGLAWQVSLFFGLNSVIYYIIVSWLPAMLQNLGFTAAQAGSLHGVLQLASAIPGFFIGSIVARLRDQRVLGVAIALTGAVGLTGLLMLPVLATLWVVLIGISTGAGIILGLAFISLRAGNAVQAAALSGMAQCVGYLLAAGGPPLAGLLHDRMDGWTVPLTVCTLLALAQAVMGYLAGRQRVLVSE